MTRRPAILALAALALGASGCQTPRAARDRIETRPATCQDASVSVYFEPFAAELTPEGRRVLAAAARSVRGCAVTSISFVGLADAVGGDAASNLELSKRRAASVTAALVAAGLTSPELQVSAAGDIGATTADGKVAPLRRRTDVTFHVTRPK